MLNNLPGAGGNPAAEEFMDTLLRLFNKAALIEREPVDTGDGILLYTSEVHLIDMAGRYPDENLSSIASRLGVTKGAVSQTVKKLEEKGYLERINPEGNNKTVFIRLTQAGLRAFEWHRAYHAVVNERITLEITSLGRTDCETMIAILGQIQKIFDDCPRTREQVTRRMKGR
ncbi:MAG: MarR family transcriptional regulator [Methanomicrobiales archaeon]|nr:MarR family transcriptional regulator [Methanomicrobiales archaeon]